MNGRDVDLQRRHGGVDMGRIIDALPVCVIGLDRSLRIHFANAAASDLLAGPAGGLLGRRLGDVFGPANPLVALARRAGGLDAAVGESDLVLEGPGFSLGRADANAIGIEDSGDVLVTLSPRGRTRNFGLARRAPPMARTLAHEVRNPLAGIRAAAQLIGKGGEAGPLAELICAEVDRIGRLTERFDALDGLSHPRFAAVNIHEPLIRARQIVAGHFPEVRFEEAYDPSLPAVRADLDMLIQTFLNLAKNAAEAVNGHTLPHVIFRTRFRPGERVRNAPDGAARAQLEASIIDNGPGLAPDIAGRAFEAFATTKPGGAGLGLAIAADIVARHEGRLEVDSIPGRTAFHVLLPIMPERSR
jgi:two-component system nitrogen regulation sensor histidine kinase GlnL